MPLAIQYGMPLDEFWHGDLRLLEAYQKAYVRNISYMAWKQGEYNRIAMEIGAKNAMATKKSERIDRWFDFKDPIKNVEKANARPNDLSVEQHNQNMWFLHDVLNK